MNQELILASESRYKKKILDRLHIAFSTTAPWIDETPGSGESARALSRRLAQQKVETVANRHPNAIVISTDQAAEVNGIVLGKPGTQQNARAMLHKLSGKTVSFFTSIGMIQPNASCLIHTEEVIVTLRQLEDREITRYVKADMPLDCAGSFKVESLGISLFKSVKSEDPTALEGLPLIQLCQWLRDQGIEIP
ncbi:MAG: Maf family nucleotide pyrophosphatase [Pseudomonadota bacterium]|nr:Maf family nucleotide pyrophosphatase [Pseudomonadota bacterium]MEE2820930.1 Maf family nucleotide pyrophosphatase [Pseudomonadota bacterium]